MNMTAAKELAPRDGTGKWAAFVSALTVSNATGLVTRAVRWCVARQRARSASRVLHVEETVSLGQKRFAAVIRVENARYLVGGGANDVVLLAALGQGAACGAEEGHPQPAEADPTPAFVDVLEEANTPQKPASVKTAGGRSKGGTKRCA
jgi:flagellar biogenesis protein FliO